MAEEAKRNSIAALRSQKPRVFEPSKAYMVFGHGYEHPHYNFVVPDNCLIVTFAFPGELVSYEKTIPMIQNLACFPTEVLQNPLAYPEAVTEIMNLTGGIVVYKPGDKCPDFHYTLLDHYTYLPGDKEYPGVHSVRISALNGVVELNEDSCSQFEELDSEKSHVYKRFRKVTGKEEFFKNSVYPSADTFRNAIAYNNHMMGGYLLDDLLSEYPQLSVLNVTQNHLCSVLPGVYYNFICRAVKGVTNTLYQEKGLSRMTFNYTGNTLKAAEPMIQNTLKQRISNAERRKALASGTFLNSPSSPNTKLWFGINVGSIQNVQDAIDAKVNLNQKRDNKTPIEVLLNRNVKGEYRKIQLKMLSMLLRAGAKLPRSIKNETRRRLKGKSRSTRRLNRKHGF